MEDQDLGIKIMISILDTCDIQKQTTRTVTG